MKIDQSIADLAHALIAAAFQEDLDGRGDITADAIAGENHSINARIVAKQSGVICGIEILKMVFDYLDASIVIDTNYQDGDRVNPGENILWLRGSAIAILTTERTALNFMGRLSGIATLTRRFVDSVSNTHCRILDTRKTTPGWRLLEKYAVRCGGGENHRMGLYDMFLIKENHIAGAGGITQAVRRCLSFQTQHHFQAPIEVETRTLEQVGEALRLPIQRIMLDNMSVDELSAAVALVHGKIPLEASGNVTLATVCQVAATGVDYISIGALTHSAPNFDVSLLFESV